MKKLVVIRGGGELATGIAHRLHNTGFQVLMLEKAAPSAIRRDIVFAEAVYDGEKKVERTICRENAEKRSDCDYGGSRGRLPSEAKAKNPDRCYLCQAEYGNLYGYGGFHRGYWSWLCGWPGCKLWY